MDVRIKATDYELTDATQEYLAQRLRSLEKFLGENASLARFEIEIGRDAGRPRHGANIYFAEIQIIHPGGKLIRATNRAETINGAIDDVKEEVERQLRREKKLHIRILRASGRFAKRLLHLGR